MNILSQTSISNFISKNKIDYFIHAAAFSTPMAHHKIEEKRSIETNIIGSANVALSCLKKNIKLIYISTNFVYPGKKEITVKKITYNLLTNMDGLNLEGSAQCTFVKIP
jgi:dTDP-4-dehydrorhamnose reductase